MQLSHPQIGVIEQTTILGSKWRIMPKAARAYYI